MKAAATTEIKQALKPLSQAKLVELCLRLARFKKENKELLSFLLFEADDLQAYIEGVEEEVRLLFLEINSSHLYYAKKSLSKILRIINKHVRYTGSRVAEVELLLFFCQQLQQSGIAYRKSAALKKMYESRLQKIKAAIGLLHPDLQYDYLKQLDAVQSAG
jgi:hypothetical protein